MKKNDVLEKIQERLTSIDIAIVRNTASLEEHIRRTELLEQEVKPIKLHVQVINTLSKIFAASVGALVGLKHLGLF